MNLTAEAVNRPIATLMAVLAVTLGGVIAMFNLPVDLMPQSETSTITIFVGVRGGMPPEDIEQLVTVPIEDSVSTMAGLKSIMSVSRKDRSTITLEFDDASDVTRATLEVSERLARVKGKMPKEIEKPIVARYNENDHPIVILSATSTAKSPEVLRTMIEHDLKPLLSRVPGVANVEISGGRQRKILVEFEKSKLEMHSLPILDVIHQLGANNVSLMSGKYETGRDAWGVQFVGDFRSLDDMRELGIAITKEGSRIRLKDVAVVRDYYMEPESYARVNNQPSVTVYVQKETGANTIKSAKGVIETITEYQKSLPSDVGVSVSIDQSVAIKQAVADVRDALTWGALLTALVLWFFLKSVKQVGVIVLSIPIAVLGTFFVMAIQSYFAPKFSVLPITINVMSLLGIALGIGRMVDDSIVVFENIVHRFNEARKSGHRFNIKAVAIQSTMEMSLAVASSTLVMVVIFLPIVFISAEVRRLFADVAFTVVISLLASLFMANTVIPLLSTYLLNFSQDPSAGLYRWEIKGMERLRKIYLKAKGFVIRRPIDSTKYSYATLVRKGTAWSVRRRGWVMMGIAVSLLISGGLYFFVLEKEFMGDTEKKEFVIFVELPAGSKLDVSDKVVTAVEAEINSLPEVKNIVKTVSSRVEGWSSKIYVTLTPGAERTRSVQDIIDELRPKLKSIGGEYEAFVYFSEPRSSAEIVIDVFGTDYLALRDVAVEVAKRMQEVPGLRDVKLRYKPGRPEIRLDVDHSRAALFGLTSKEIADTLHAEIRGLRATYFNAGNEQVETVARLSEEDRRTLENISNLTLISRTKKKYVVPVQQVLSLEHGFTPSEVWRRDKERVIQVSANRERLALSTAVDRIQKGLRTMRVPIGYHYEFGGDYKKLVQSEREFQYAFIIMLSLVYMVLACFFESYTQPFLMLLTVPLALAGSMPMLWLTKTSVNMGVYIGLLMLGGTVVSNAVECY
jgi:hydrophobic/amphiphilic exporter-1 (mainly G- bacteria), HAE1 family